MKAGAKYLLSLQLLVLLLFAPVAFAQEDAPPEIPVFTQQELDQMLAPIALYPDSLLSHILMASTYPLEVVAAARWSRANPGLRGERAVQAVEDQSWDPSVKSLVAFPQILTMMDEKLAWMQQLGDAFLAQQTQVMDTVQALRQRAYDAGNLESNQHYRVERQGETIIVESPQREVIYVPYYDPLVVYGTWWWPAHPPVYWAAWPGYYPHAVFTGWHWSVGVFVGPRFFFGISDWRHRHVKVVHVHHHHGQRVQVQKVWRHNPHHRRGVGYRHPAVQQRFVGPRAVHDARRDFGMHRRASAPNRSSSGHDNAKRGHAARQREAQLAPRQEPGVGRLGMRHDRHVTSRHPNLPDVDKPQVRPRAHAPSGSRDWRERRRSQLEAHRRSSPATPPARWRVNTPQIRAAPNHAAPSPSTRVGPATRPHPSARNGGRHMQPDMRGRLPQAGGARVPQSFGRAFTRGSVNGSS